MLTEKGLAKGGFSAGHRAGDPDNIPGGRLQADIPEDIRVAVVGKAEIFNGQAPGGGNLRGGQCLRLPHQRLNALPGNLGPLHCVKELGRLGGFHRQLAVAGQEGGKGGNVPDLPPPAQHIPAAIPEDEHHAQI